MEVEKQKLSKYRNLKLPLFKPIIFVFKWGRKCGNLYSICGRILPKSYVYTPTSRKREINWACNASIKAFRRPFLNRKSSA